MSDRLLQLEGRAAALLAAAPFFADVPVLVAGRGDLTERIAQALAGRGLTAGGGKKPGLSVIVTTLGGAAVVAAARVDLKPTLVVAVLENPLINQSDSGTGKPALAVVPEVIAALQGQSVTAAVGAANATERFSVGDPAFELLNDDVKQRLYGISGGLGYHVLFSATIRL